jgi:PilZ domain
MSDDKDILSVDQVTSLMRLYLDWPEHVEKTGDVEAKRFYQWLASELDESLLAEITGGINGVRHFLSSNTAVVHAGRYLKNADAHNAKNVRVDERIPTSTQVFIVIYDCGKDHSLEGTSLRGMMMDMARNGMRLESKIAIPVGSIVSMTVAHTGTPITYSHLTGEVRWVSHTAETNHIGIVIFNIEDYEKWRDHFSSTLGQGT